MSFSYSYLIPADCLWIWEFGCTLELEGKEKRIASLPYFTIYSDLKNMFWKTFKLDGVPGKVPACKRAISFSGFEVIAGSFVVICT
jgi:hypothetical protein